MMHSKFEPLILVIKKLVLNLLLVDALQRSANNSIVRYLLHSK